MGTPYHIIIHIGLAYASTHSHNSPTIIECDET